MSEILFHSLRHTGHEPFKNAGVSSAVAMDIIGHDTDVESETTRSALSKLPKLL